MNKNTKWIIGAIVAVLVIWLGYSMSGVKKPVSAETIKIGVAMPLTGKGASYGEKIKNAIALGIEEANKKYDFSLEARYEDTQSEADSAVSAVKKLISVDGVNIILGPIRSNSTLAAAPIAETNKVILFTPMSSAEDITNAGDYIFRNRETAKAHGIGMAEFLRKRGVEKLALFVANSANSQTYGKHLEENFIVNGGEISFSANYDENTKDFRTDLAKAKNSGAEAIYVASAIGSDLGIITKQLREMQFDGYVTASAAIESEEFLSAAGEFANGVIYTSPVFDLEGENTKQYADNYRAKYGMDSGAFAANGYDAVNIIAMAIEDCGGDKSDCIRDYLYQVKNYPGAGGLTTFDKNGDVVKPVMLKTVKNGEFVKYEE